MTPLPWIVTSLKDQTLITATDGHYVALFQTSLQTHWTMDTGDLRLMIASPKLLAALRESTTQLTRLKTRYPQEVGLDIYIEYNQRLIEAIEEET